MRESETGHLRGGLDPDSVSSKNGTYFSRSLKRFTVREDLGSKPTVFQFVPRFFFIQNVKKDFQENTSQGFQFHQETRRICVDTPTRQTISCCACYDNGDSLPPLTGVVSGETGERGGTPVDPPVDVGTRNSNR